MGIQRGVKEQEGRARGVGGRREEWARESRGYPAETLHSPDSRQGGPSPPHQLRSERQESAPLAWDTQKGNRGSQALGKEQSLAGASWGLGMRAEEGAPVPGGSCSCELFTERCPVSWLRRIENRCGFLESGALGSE